MYVWERQIRTIRSVLDGILIQNGTQLNTSALCTFLYETMAIINSRPLTVNDLEDSNGPLPLSPNIILTRKSGIVPPPPPVDFLKEDIYARKRWCRVQYITNLFLTRWAKEYLCSLQARKTWQGTKENIIVDDIVMLKDENVLCSDWRLAKVVETYHSSDGLARKVKLLMPLQTWIKQLRLAKSVSRVRLEAVKVTDQRVCMINEIIQCIKLIKMYAWEMCFLKSVKEIRSKEFQLLEKAGYVQSIVMSLSPIVSLFAAALTFALHTLTGNDLTASKAFTVVGLFECMRFALVALPFSIKSLSECKVALDRIQEILLMEEIHPIVRSTGSQIHAVDITMATFTWKKHLLGKEKSDTQIDNLVTEESTMTRTLDMNIVIEKGELIGICGGVGSGKSSFVLALLNQMTMLEGDISVDGTFAYAPQQPWIINATVRENILFGSLFDRDKYNFTLSVCCLQHDLHVLPKGELTEVS
uniref:Multidrug resistance-associated protein 5-like n=1 Tax=Saccoglossus kowalevskii TaxID=10224 RepID=A0ABM0M9J2_SACKO|nr:PREDICTED: multidrug resistance-associated protein 5-like [Saccoglossus kowalevskii]